jgi:Mg2+ and Co2+ transporter CorA
MQANIFDGQTWQTCTPELAAQAMTNTDLSWVDIHLDSATDSSADQIITALGIDAPQFRTSLDPGSPVTFSLSGEKVNGTFWLSDDDDDGISPGRFTFDQHRLVTMRTSGDAALEQVKNQLQQRAALAVKQPSRVLGFVLQAMLETVAERLTSMTVDVGALDMDIISTPDPNAQQTAQLVAYRQTFQPFAMRFPSYVVQVQGSLIDPDTITEIDQAGVQELQSYSALAQSTASLAANLIDAIRNTAQDLQGQISNWQGNRINQLTIVTIVFLPITFLTGYFGMNFQWLDNGLESASAYLVFGIVLPLILLAGSAAWLARRGFRLGLRREHDQRKQSAR